MNQKTYFQQIRRYDSMIDNKLTEVANLKAIALSITGTWKDDIVQSSGSKDKIGDTVAKIVDLQNEINADVDRLIDLKREAMKIVDQIDFPYRDILYKRYFQFKSWEQIACEMNFSYRHITRMHGKALQEAKRILDCEVANVD